MYSSKETIQQAATSETKEKDFWPLGVLKRRINSSGQLTLKNSLLQVLIWDDDSLNFSAGQGGRAIR